MHDGPHIARPSAITGSMNIDPVATQGTQAMQAAQSMAQAGITGLSGGQAGPGSFTITNPNTNQTQTYTTTQNDQGGSTTTTTNQQGNIINQVSTDQQGNLVPQQSQNEGTSGDDDKKSAIENLLSNTMFGQFVQGLGSTNEFFENLAKKGVSGLRPADKIILANLIRAGGIDTLDMQKFADKYKIDVEELKDRFTQAEDSLAAGVNIGGPNEGKIVSYEDLVNNFLSGEPTGLGESFSTMGVDLKDLVFDPLRTTPNLVREDGSYTLEGLKNVLGKEGIAYLQANKPDLYLSAFGLPQTGAGLEQFANMSLQGLTSSDKDKKLAQMIIEARERLAEDRGGNQPQGIPSIPGIPSLPVPRPGPIPPDSYPLPGQPPFMPGPILPPGVVPPYGSKFEKTPYNYYAQSPQYRFRGVPSLNTDAFNEELRNKFGMA